MPEITVGIQVTLSTFQNVLDAFQSHRHNPNVGLVQQINERRDATLLDTLISVDEGDKRILLT